jgi:spore germination protein
MEYPREITVIQATTILVSTIIGVGVLPLPLFAVRAADTGAPLVTFIAIVLAFLGLWVLTVLGMRFPNQSIITYSDDIIGKWAGRLFSLIIIAFFAVLTGLASREFGSVVVSAVLRETPLEVTVIVMLLLAAVFTRSDMNVFAYIHNFYLPIILAPGLIIVVLSLKNANTLYLQPLWGNGPDGMLTGILIVAALFQGSFVMTIIIPLMRRPERAMTASIWGIVISGSLYLMIVIATVAVFGPEELKKLLWPTLELARTTSLPGNILQRLDVIFIAVWVTAVFTTIFSSYMFTVHALSKVMRLRDHRLFSLAILPIVFLIAMIPENVVLMYEIVQFVGISGLFITIGYPSLLLLIAVIRKKRGKRDVAN